MSKCKFGHSLLLYLIWVSQPPLLLVWLLLRWLQWVDEGDEADNQLQQTHWSSPQGGASHTSSTPSGQGDTTLEERRGMLTYVGGGVTTMRRCGYSATITCYHLNRLQSYFCSCAIDHIYYIVCCVSLLFVVLLWIIPTCCYIFTVILCVCVFVCVCVCVCLCVCVCVCEWMCI